MKKGLTGHLSIYDLSGGKPREVSTKRRRSENKSEEEELSVCFFL